MGRLLVISGVPASGKSTFCLSLAWQGWAFINHDEITASTLDQTWWRLVTSGRAGEFVPLTSAAGQDVVLEFGFPMALLPAVRQLKAAGADHWWFKADHDAAREVFVARNRAWQESRTHGIIPIQAFEKYVSDLAAHRAEIRKLFAAKIIETRDRDGTRVTVEEIHRRIFGERPSPEAVPD
ncbi:MAG TPA: hypothetical protein VGU71_21675 [Candidatus Dormibacteraeota bacterium]|nr:hypothetical protein [Candidatus Dormibacteraeota bacterium]